MKHAFIISLCALSACGLCAAEIDNTIHDGGEYVLYNTYYGRTLGGNADDSSPALSAYGTNSADDYVFVAEASTLHSGYYWLKHKKSGKYLQASNADGNTWSVWLAGSLNPQYNSYEWGLTGGIEGNIISNRGEVINGTNYWLAPDPDHETETYVSVYYDKPLVDRAIWQIVTADAPLDDARLALYIYDINATIAQGESILNNPAYGTQDEQYALAAALYNARNAVLGATCLDDVAAITNAKEALAAEIANSLGDNYAIWVSGSSFVSGNTFTIALNGVEFAPAASDTDLPYCTMVVRGGGKTGALIDINAKEVKIGDASFEITTKKQSHDLQFAFDGNAVVVYIDGQKSGIAEQGEVPTMSACGQAAEWTVYGIKTLTAYRPEIIHETKDVEPGTPYINANNKAEANVIKLVNQKITLDGSIDYHISSEMPIDSLSVIDIKHDDAWVIIDNVRPSDVISDYLRQFTFNGDTAWLERYPYIDADSVLVTPDNSGVNCRVGMYLQGAVIIPHDNSYEPFCGYSDTGYAGNAFVLPLGDNHELGENDNTMRSFVLKRGYMVTLATQADGGGYSRVYVADHQDKRISDLPELLRDRVSFAFVRKWNYVSKKGFCGTSSDESMAEQCKLLGATWFYSWSASRESQPDVEFVPMQCHRFWPSLEDFYPKYNSTAMLLLNEPEHAEQHTSNRCSCGGTTDSWTACTMNPNYLHTGLRIGGPSPTDGSWLKEYIGHCNDMAYRCDFVGYHAYWGTNEAADAAAWKSRLQSIYNNTKRPIWMTEWNNGASWTKETWPSSWNDKLDYQRRKVIEICNMFDATDFIERYAIFNLSEDQRKVLKWDSEADGWWVTPAGEAYREHKSVHAYKESMQFVPVGWFPSLKEDVTLTASLDETTKTLNLAITNPNGDNSATETVTYLDYDNNYQPLCITPRHLLENTAMRESSVPVSSLPAEAFMSDKLVLRLNVTTHKGGEAQSKRVVLNIPESMRVESGIETVSTDCPNTRFFNLQGVEVMPTPGKIHIVLQGNRAFKAIVK